MAHPPSPAERNGKTARPTKSCHGKINNLIQTEVLRCKLQPFPDCHCVNTKAILSLCQHQGQAVIVCSTSRPDHHHHCVFNIKARLPLCQHQGHTVNVLTSRPYCHCVNTKAILSLCQHQGHTVSVLTSRPYCHCVNIKAILSLCQHEGQNQQSSAVQQPQY